MNTYNKVPDMTSLVRILGRTNWTDSASSVLSFGMLANCSGHMRSKVNSTEFLSGSSTLPCLFSLMLFDLSRRNEWR